MREIDFGIVTELSMEEFKLMQSLERLEELCKIQKDKIQQLNDETENLKQRIDHETDVAVYPSPKVILAGEIRIEFFKKKIYLILKIVKNLKLKVMI